MDRHARLTHRRARSAPAVPRRDGLLTGRAGRYRWVLPLIGFFLLPWTTLAYAGMWEVGGRGVAGFAWFLVILTFVVDLGSYTGASRGRD